MICAHHYKISNESYLHTFESFQAYKLMELNEHHEYLNQSLIILFGIWAFFMIERILKIIFTMQKVRMLVLYI